MRFPKSSNRISLLQNLHHHLSSGRIEASGDNKLFVRRIALNFGHCIYQCSGRLFLFAHMRFAAATSLRLPAFSRWDQKPGPMPAATTVPVPSRIWQNAMARATDS